MKKAIIATAVVLVLSFVSTVCFGVALGSQGLRAFFRDGGVLDEWSGAVSDWNDALLYTTPWRIPTNAKTCFPMRARFWKPPIR